MTERERYRRTDRTMDVGFVFGALAAIQLPGPMLVRLLTELHMTESAARNTLAKMVRQGVLVAEPVGRMRRYALSASTLLRYRQVQGAAGPASWEGSFAAVIHQVPESARWFRDRLLYYAAYHGYGTLRPGVLIAVHDRAEHLYERLGPCPEGARLHRTRLQPEDLAEARHMAAEAWDLEQLTAEHHRVLAVIEDRLHREEDLPETDEGWWEAFRTWNRLYRDVYGVQLQDPNLPGALLPARWPGVDHRARLAALNRVWGPPLSTFLRRQGTPEVRALARYEESLPW